MSTFFIAPHQQLDLEYVLLEVLNELIQDELEFVVSHLLQ